MTTAPSKLLVILEGAHVVTPSRLGARPRMKGLFFGLPFNIIISGMLLETERAIQNGD